MNDAKIERSFPDLAGSLAALKRAAQRARRIAEQTGTELVVASRGGLPKGTTRQHGAKAKT